jgi:hypothetical protein
LDIVTPSEAQRRSYSILDMPTVEADKGTKLLAATTKEHLQAFKLGEARRAGIAEDWLNDDGTVAWPCPWQAPDTSNQTGKHRHVDGG